METKTFRRTLLSAGLVILLLSVQNQCLAQWQLKSFLKYEGNPILAPRGDSWESKDVFNPAVWTDGETVYLFYRAEDSTGIGKWNGTSRIGLATSTNGTDFDRLPEPVLEPTEPWELPGGTEDPRITRVDSTFYMTYTAYDGETARLALATSRDLKTWEKHGLVFPELEWSKSGAILDQPVDGKYWMYFGDTNIWAAWSEDLIHWNRIEQPVIKPRKGKFDSRLVEPGPPPLITDRGILMLYNGADRDLVYNAGQVLFDRTDPTEVINRSDSSFLQPDTQLEQHGQIPNVVFIEGMVRFRGAWYLYYGMGDSGIGVAISRE